MTIETLRRIARKVAIQRAADGEPEPRRELSDEWFRSICGWCGKTYDRRRGRSSTYCSDECHHLATRVARKGEKEKAVRKKRLAKRRDARYRPIAELMRARIEEKLKTLLADVAPDRWFTTADAKFIWKISRENSMNWLDKFVDSGIARKRRSGHYEYAIDPDNERVKAVLNAGKNL